MSGAGDAASTSSATGGGTGESQPHEMSKLSDFKLLKKLGSGSFGSVHCVERLETGRLYAMKQVDISDLSDQEQAQAAREAQILARMDSEYVVQYFDSFVDDEALCIVMELCDGDLHRALKARRGELLPETMVRSLFIQICCGLAFLHSHRIMHRDLKAANVFLVAGSAPEADAAKSTGGASGPDLLDDPDGSVARSIRVRVGDLGVAKLLSTQTRFSRTLTGSPFYLSPELLSEKPYNQKSDCWALGCILYELLTLRHPFDARNQGALILKILQGTYPPISRTQYSPEIRGLVDELLTRDSRRRPSVMTVLSKPFVAAWAAELGLELPAEALEAAARRAAIKGAARSAAMGPGSGPGPGAGAGAGAGGDDAGAHGGRKPGVPPSGRGTKGTPGRHRRRIAPSGAAAGSGEGKDDDEEDDDEDDLGGGIGDDGVHGRLDGGGGSDGRHHASGSRPTSAC